MYDGLPSPSITNAESTRRRLWKAVVRISSPLVKPMPIHFTCPHCGAETDVAEQYAGRSGPCANCGQTVTVPPPAGTPGYTTPSTNKGAYAAAVIVLFVVVGLVMILMCSGVFFFSWRMSAPMMVPPTAVTIAPAGECLNNLKQIGLAMHNYHDVHKCFPPAYLPDEDGKPMHSWRVLLLPYMEQKPLYDMYNFDEPWDSPNNLAVAQMMPAEYRCPEDSLAGPTETSYLMVVGPETLSDGPTNRRIAEISDGTSNTIMVVECSGLGIGWAEPSDLGAEDLTYAINDGSPDGIRSNHSEGANVLMCDGSVRCLDVDLPVRQIKAMTTIAGGEPIDQSVFE